MVLKFVESVVLVPVTKHNEKLAREVAEETKRLLRSMTKEQWIQKAKALLFDCTFDLESWQLRKECQELIKEGGGYDYEVESSETPLKWPNR